MSAESVEFSSAVHQPPIALAAAPPAGAEATVASLRVPGFYERGIKPVVDRFVALAVAVVVSPLFLLVALVVLAEFGRPMLFCQERVGKDGRIFTVYKFRTMRRDRRSSSRPVPAHRDRRRTHKSEHDPRHTQIGRLLRKTSLDELPQLWNILRGDMSLVGPRPELVEIVDRYSPWQRRRHDVKPGLTGLWQVSARGGAPMHEVTHIDLEYVDSLSLLTDIRILAKTPAVVLLKRSGS